MCPRVLGAARGLGSTHGFYPRVLPRPRQSPAASPLNTPHGPDLKQTTPHHTTPHHAADIGVPSLVILGTTHPMSRHATPRHASY